MTHWLDTGNPFPTPSEEAASQALMAAEWEAEMGPLPEPVCTCWRPELMEAWPDSCPIQAHREAGAA